MEEKLSLVKHYLPKAIEWSDLLLSSPWLSAVLMVLTLLSMRRHSELAYGSHHSKLLSLLLMVPYFAVVLLGDEYRANSSFIPMFLVVLLSDGIVVSLNRSRSPYFVFDMGLRLLFSETTMPSLRRTTRNIGIKELFALCHLPMRHLWLR